MASNGWVAVKKWVTFFWTYSPEHEGNFTQKVLKVIDGSDVFHAAQLAFTYWLDACFQATQLGRVFFDSCDNIKKTQIIFCSIVAMSTVAFIDILDQNVGHV